LNLQFYEFISQISSILSVLLNYQYKKLNNMKKYFAITFFFMGMLLQAFSQAFSTINIFTYKCIEGQEIIVYLNEVKAGSLMNFENLQYKMFSEGRVKITVAVGEQKGSVIKDIVKGSAYYILITNNMFSASTYGGTAFITAKFVDEKEFARCIKLNKKTTQKEEDLTNPVVKSSEGETRQGTCFLISKKGYLITNYHILSGNKIYQVKGIAGDFNKFYDADMVAVDIDLDLALLKLKDQTITFEDIPYVIGTEANLQGSKSYVLGYPLTSEMGQEIKITEGIISANSGYKGTVSQYQFSAPVQPGNSGSPLFSEKGELIGVINAKLFGAEGAGYAIKSPYFLTFLKMVEGFKIEQPATPVIFSGLSEMTAKLKKFIFILKSE
jgi:S1-C subfamily serine protease